MAGETGNFGESVSGENEAVGLKRMFVKSKLIPALANIIRTPVATTRGTRATHWLGYTDKTHLRGLKNPNFLLVRLGGESSPEGGFPSVGDWRTRRDFACVVANYIRPKLLKHPLRLSYQILSDSDI